MQLGDVDAWDVEIKLKKWRVSKVCRFFYMMMGSWNKSKK